MEKSFIKEVILQCGNLRILLPLRFYVRSNLAILESQKLSFWPKIYSFITLSNWNFLKNDQNCNIEPMPCHIPSSKCWHEKFDLRMTGRTWSAFIGFFSIVMNWLLKLNLLCKKHENLLTDWLSWTKPWARVWLNSTCLTSKLRNSQCEKTRNLFLYSVVI